jgi:glutathione synthase/RimK-type ligase-like ATP-grasp enzyme
MRDDVSRAPEAPTTAAPAAGAGARPRPAPGGMRLLITNPWNGQAYCVLRSLRGRASRVIATAYREHGWLGRLAPAAVSRFVDRVYPVPLAIQDWRRGGLDAENTPTEESYVRAVLDICDREDIDTVFPSWDPEVLLLSKNMARFARRGITVPVPEWPVLRGAMDKHALVRAATEMGFPCPRTYLPRTLEDAGDLAKRLGYPVVVKPRFTVRGRGSSLVSDPETLDETVRRVQPTFGMPLLQEWIPGGLDQRVSVAVTLDRHGRPITVHARRHLRTVLRSFVSLPCAQATCTEMPVVGDAIRLLQGLGYVGHARVQMKVDPRDGVAKLMEINCRPGYRIWCEIAVGQPVPQLCVEIGRGAEVDPLPPHAGPDVFLNPVEDAVSLVARLLDWTARRIVPGPGGAAPDPHPSPRAMLREYRDTYRAPRRHFDWYFRALADDPLAALAWYASHLLGARRAHEVERAVWGSGRAARGE